jgi:hypothetical protein
MLIYLTKGTEMASRNITIEDVKKKKIELESSILKLIQGFEKECGVYCSHIHFDRQMDEKNSLEAIEPVGPSKRGPIKNVDVNMDLDLIY